MASKSVGTGVVPDREEERPLLERVPPSYQTENSVEAALHIDGEHTDADGDAEDLGDGDRDLQANTPRSWWTVAAYAVLAAGVVTLFVFIVKGFIEADDLEFDFGTALKSALGGGLSGAAAMVLQVLTLMPLRTVMNYQYRYGTSTTQAIRTLHADGGYKRYYQGLTAALVQGPISRFGDTAANAGILALLASSDATRELPEHVKTLFVSSAVALFRMVLTPVDTVKTTMQTQGKEGMVILRKRVKMYGVGSLWYGAWATAAATWVGNYPWFSTYNYLNTNLPPSTTLIEKLLRQGFIGFAAAVVSDTVSNSLRVLKTYRQVNDTRIGYVDAARAVIAQDGVLGLFGRGLRTRILANGLQSIMFSILWKLFMDLWDDKTQS